MFSHSRSEHHARPPYESCHHAAPRPEVMEDTLDKGVMETGRKTFVLLLKENPRGRYLRIVEQSGEYHQSIVIPASGLEDFKQILLAMVEAHGEFPPAVGSLSAE